MEILQATRDWLYNGYIKSDIFEVTKGKNPLPRIHYPATLSFRFDGEMKTAYEISGTTLNAPTFAL